MKSTDQHDPALFLAPADAVVPEPEAELADSSAEAMTRLRDPFAVAPEPPRNASRHG
ncbi:hypothetical protein ACFQFC_20830 [Amorphoplanes digitatis]|uniref:Uncharacterized protein n=1 Tax=Actinoplanes digitatis TaxID=1868 RepID=A0A7W7I5F9_9ACTN|nr:hypothetical protein [Actinoplanes digitatis]MBB4766664.1 hypothetical protein [Actinoplanes digitatis]BFE76801.1 hypothetical protein GCM10020092_101020 [Actinoplanes digitatis]GID96166.1 hypothetical protein Adi01nite_55780 [Actinoplanes digitatis]